MQTYHSLAQMFYSYLRTSNYFTNFKIGFQI